MDSWFIWLASLAFSLVSYISLFPVIKKAGFYWSIPLLWWVAIVVTTIFAANFLASSLVVWQLRKRCEEAPSVLVEAVPHQDNISSISKVSLLISMAETGTFFLLFATALIAETIYEHYYPPQFGIYDI